MDPKVVREQAIRDAKENLILDAALKVFADKGFHGSRLEDIAAAAGFSKASLYNYYTDKEAIFQNLMIREYRCLQENLSATIDPGSPFPVNLKRLLETIFASFSKHFGIIADFSHSRMMHVLRSPQLCAVQENQAEHAKNIFAGIEDVFIRLISNAQASGEIGSSLPATVLSSYLGSLVRGVLLEWKVSGVMGDIGLEAEQLLSFIHAGFTMPCGGSSAENGTSRKDGDL